MDSLNLYDWLGPNASSFMPAELAAPYFPPDTGDPTQAPSSSVAERLARKGLTASSPKSAAFDEGIDDWIFPTADPAVPYLSGSAKDQQRPPSSAAADRLARKGLRETPPKAATLDDGPDDWIVPPAQTQAAGSPAATSGGNAFNRVFANDGGPDDWIYPQPAKQYEPVPDAQGRLWDKTTGIPLVREPKPGSRIADVAHSYDGGLLLTFTDPQTGTETRVDPTKHVVQFQNGKYQVFEREPDVVRPWTLADMGIAQSAWGGLTAGRDILAGNVAPADVNRRALETAGLIAVGAPAVAIAGRRATEPFSTTASETNAGRATVRSAEESNATQPADDALRESSPRSGDDHPPIAAQLTGDELGEPRYPGHLRLLARQYAEENFLDRSVTNAETGISIGFNRSGLKKATSGKRGPDLLRLIPAIPEMLERGHYIKTEPDIQGRRNVRAIHQFGATVDLGGKTFDTISFVRETNDGRFFYDYGILRGPGMPGLARP